MRQALIILPLLAFLAVGCEPISEKDRERKDEAVAALSAIGERLPALKAKLEGLIERGKSIALEVQEIRAKVKAGSFPAADALELVSSLMAEKEQIGKTVVGVRDDIKELLALGKKADTTLSGIRKSNQWAWARTIGEGALALVLAYLGVSYSKRGASLALATGSLEARSAKLRTVEKTRDVLIGAIENYPEVHKAAKSEAINAGVLPELHAAVKRIT